jgi:DNA-binding transcriptional regulator YhcF (GntR family)
MQFSLDKSQRSSLFEQAREQIIAALHTGKLRAGDRLPSVRQTAFQNGVNLKTAFSIYRRLRDEGYLELRTGSGAYVSDIESGGLDKAYRLSVFDLIKSNVAQAARLKLSPAEYGRLVARFVDESSGKSAQLAFIECNQEQVTLFSSEISNRLRVKTTPILLGQLESPGARLERLVHRADYVVTTDYHYNEVRKLVEPYEKQTLRVRLNPTFVPALVNAARKGGLLMIVSNTDFFPAFRRNLLGIGTPPAVLDRIEAVDDRDISRIRAAMAEVRAVYISPTCRAGIDNLIRRDVERITISAMLSSDSVEMIQAILLFHS